MAIKISENFEAISVSENALPDKLEYMYMTNICMYIYIIIVIIIGL